MARKIPCTLCGKLGWRSIATDTWTPPPRVCRECRAANSTGRTKTKSDYRTPCADCAAPSYGERCRSCSDRAQGYVPGGSTKRARRKALEGRRVARDRLAPGWFTPTRRGHLLVKWKAQGRLCTYCQTAPVESVDHVIPLALGGTNHEGNLAPACHPCNRSKMDNLLSAWRYGVRVRRWRTEVEPAQPRPPRTAKPRVARQLTLTICPMCLNIHNLSALYCSDPCRVEKNRRVQRDLYRARQGLPVDPNQPTKPWLKALRGRVFSDAA